MQHNAQECQADTNATCDAVAQTAPQAQTKNVPGDAVFAMLLALMPMLTVSSFSMMGLL